MPVADIFWATATAKSRTFGPKRPIASRARDMTKDEFKQAARQAPSGLWRRTLHALTETDDGQ